MNRPYLVLVNGILYTRKINRIAARKAVELLQAKGLKASFAEEIAENDSANLRNAVGR